MSEDFVSVTELSGDEVSAEQIQRAVNRYHWAAGFCRDKDVLEVACGTGFGLDLLAREARRVFAGDFSAPLLQQVRTTYGTRFPLIRLDGQQLPLADAALDVVLIAEALYYLPDVARFFDECVRVLRPGGVLLVVTSNKDLFDFNPSPHSFRYLGVRELSEALQQRGFRVAFHGDTPVGSVSLRQRILRPIKWLATRLGLVPKTMKGKKLLKRLVFGQMRRMPAILTTADAPPQAPTPLPGQQADTTHKVICCVGYRG